MSSLNAMQKTIGVTLNCLLFQADKFVGMTFQNIRVRSELTQTQVAERLSELLKKDISQSYVSKIETGEISVSIDRMMAFCQTYEILPSKFMHEVERMIELAGDQ